MIRRPCGCHRVELKQLYQAAASAVQSAVSRVIEKIRMPAGSQCGLSFSLLYAPPEVINAVEAQARGMRADPKTDMWAMGVIAYELLTRTRIFPASLSKQEVR